MICLKPFTTSTHSHAVATVSTATHWKQILPFPLFLSSSLHLVIHPVYHSADTHAHTHAQTHMHTHRNSSATVILPGIYILREEEIEKVRSVEHDEGDSSNGSEGWCTVRVIPPTIFLILHQKPWHPARMPFRFKLCLTEWFELTAFLRSFALNCIL